MNKVILVMLLVLIAVVLLLAMLALGYSRNWGVSGEATSTPTSEFPTLGPLKATPTRTPPLTPTLPPLGPAPTNMVICLSGDIALHCTATPTTPTPLKIPIIETLIVQTPRTPTPTH